MIPVGYMLMKVVPRPDWLNAAGVEDICSVSGCISPPFAEYINYWRHNGYWFFNSPKDIYDLCKSEKIDTSGHTLFYYEAFEKQFHDDSCEWQAFEPERSFLTQVEPPTDMHLAGFDVTSFSVGTSPECSPLSCNHVAAELPVNRHCLFDTLGEAKNAIEGGKFDHSEPGPYRIIAVYTVAPL